MLHGLAEYQCFIEKSLVSIIVIADVGLNDQMNSKKQ